MTAIDGIVSPQQSQHLSPIQAFKAVQVKRTLTSYELLETSVERIMKWIGSHPVLARQALVDGVIYGELSTIIDSNSWNTQLSAKWLTATLHEFSEAIRYWYIVVSTAIAAAVNSVGYRLFLALSQSVLAARSLPTTFKNQWKSCEEFVMVMQSQDLRELLFIEYKLNLFIFSKKITILANQVLGFAKKAYLALMVVGALLGTALGSFVGGSSSLIEQTANRNALTAAFENYGIGGSQLLSRDVLKLRKTTLRSFIQEHIAEKDQTIAFLSSLYGVKEETIRFNNSISGDSVAAQSKIYIPPVDSYILINDKEVKIDDLVRIYKVDKNELLSYNPLLAAKESLETGSVTLIPVADFALVNQLKKEEDERVVAEAKKAETAKFRAQALAGVAYKKLDFLDPNRAADLNFVLPVDAGINKATTYWGHINNAVDFGGGATNPNIYSVGKGVVVEVKSDCPRSSTWCSGVNGFYGNYITIDHGAGYLTRYAHLRQVDVSIGQNVTPGQQIGLMGESGNSYGVHLHFEVIKDGYGVFPPQAIPAIQMWR